MKELKPCIYCDIDIDAGRSQENIIEGRLKLVMAVSGYIEKDEDAISLEIRHDLPTAQLYFCKTEINYCPMCGRPLSDQAIQAWNTRPTRTMNDKINNMTVEDKAVWKLIPNCDICKYKPKGICYDRGKECIRGIIAYLEQEIEE